MWRKDDLIFPISWNAGLMSTMITSDLEICSCHVLDIDPQPFEEISDTTSINCTIIKCIPYQLKQLNDFKLRNEIKEYLLSSLCSFLFLTLSKDFFMFYYCFYYYCFLMDCTQCMQIFPFHVIPSVMWYNNYGWISPWDFYLEIKALILLYEFTKNFSHFSIFARKAN